MASILKLEIPSNHGNSLRTVGLLKENDLALHVHVPYVDDGASYALLLKTARIIQLNEIERYFFQNGDQNWVINPRNEIQALQYLRREVGKDSTATRLDWLSPRIQKSLDILSFLDPAPKEHASEITTCSSIPGVSHKLTSANFPSTGRGVTVVENLKFGDVVASIPTDKIITYSSALESDFGPELKRIPQIDDETRVILWTMHERKDPNSKYAYFFSGLPEKFVTGLSLCSDLLGWLAESSVFQEIKNDSEVIRKSFNAVLPYFNNVWRRDAFPADMFTWENYLWAVQLWYSYGMKLRFPDGKIQTCLVPIASLFNHSTVPHITDYGTINPTTNCLELKLVRSCQKGEQCFLSYGPLTNSDLLKDYGFVIKDNIHDYLSLDLDGLIAEDDVLEGRKTIVLTKLGLSLENHFLRNVNIENRNREPCLPKEFMAVMRVICMDDQTIATRVNPLREMISVENEILSLNMLRSCMDGLLEFLNDALEPSGKDDASQLVVKFRSEYRALLNSIADLCDKKLVELTSY